MVFYNLAELLICLNQVIKLQVHPILHLKKSADFEAITQFKTIFPNNTSNKLKVRESHLNFFNTKNTKKNPIKN